MVVATNMAAVASRAFRPGTDNRPVRFGYRIFLPAFWGDLWSLAACFAEQLLGWSGVLPAVAGADQQTGVTSTPRLHGASSSREVLRSWCGPMANRRGRRACS